MASCSHPSGCLASQAEYWDAVAEDKTFTHPLDLDALFSLVPADAAILDYGCGYGRTVQELFQAGCRRATGVDISSNMIARGKRTYPHLDLRVQPGRDLAFEDASFDAALLFAVLTCIPDGDAQRHLVREIFRVLRPGGVLYVSDYTLQTDARNLERYAASRDEFGVYGIFRHADGPVFRHHDPAWIKELLSGFRQVRFQDIRVATLNGNRARAFQYFGVKP